MTGRFGLHDDRETASQSDPSFAHRRSPGDREGPVLEFEPALIARQDDVGGLVEEGSHPPVGNCCPGCGCRTSLIARIAVGSLKRIRLRRTR